MSIVIGIIVIGAIVGCLAAIPLMFMGLRSVSIVEKKRIDELKKISKYLDKNS